MSRGKVRSSGAPADDLCKRVAFQTFGCRLNQYDSDCLKGEFRALGYTVVGGREPAGLVVVNTCSVTAEAERQARQFLRRIARSRPGTRIVVTGCYAERAQEELKDLPGVTRVIGNSRKHELVLGLSLTGERGPEPGRGEESSGRSQEVNRLRTLSLERTRPYLRIQDGCDNFCSYCIVPFTRGGRKSVEPDWVVAEAGRIVRLGGREIVLTGARLGAYGSDRNPRSSLSDILERLVLMDGDFRVRLSSIEPDELTGSILELMAASPKICPHLHIPLQSGSDRVLRRMRRKYTCSFFSDLVRRVRSILPHCAIGTDVIVGFPGETDADFEATLRALRELPVNYAHVFPFSPRPKTAASRMEDDVPRAVKDERSALLRSLSAQKWLSFRSRLIGKTVEALFEKETPDGVGVGLTGNYVRLSMPREKWREDGFTRAVISRVRGSETFGEAAGGRRAWGGK